MGHGTLLNQSMRRQLLETGHITNNLDGRDTPKQVSSILVWNLQSVSLSLSLSAVNFRVFLVWGKPENIS